MTVTADRTGRGLDTTLDPRDRWSTAAARVHLSGVQATIRVLVDTLRADRAAGRRTAAFVSGYQGSPLAGFDKELQVALSGGLDVEIVHRPAVNEEGGATAVMGSQLASTLPSARLDGVLGVWYGKAPGLDRSIDALRHANFAGASAWGGALAVVGDDPSAKSSTLPSASEGILADLAMPIVFPRSLADVLELGRHAVAMSRYTGAWVGVKLATSVADAEGTVAVVEWPPPVLPDGYHPPEVTGDLLTPGTVERERLVLADRLAAAARYGDANRLNRMVAAPVRPRVVLVAAGTVFSELQEALTLMGLDPEALLRLGVGLAEVRMPYPVGREFAAALAPAPQVVVVEEHREVVEHQLLSLLARRPGGPAVLGRLDLDGRPFIPRHGRLSATAIAAALYPVLSSAVGPEVREPPAPRRRIEVRSATTRVPWFCPGCPHSVSTVVPDETLVGEGIGCHSIVHYMPESRVGRRIGLTQMGGEGAQWIGMEPFVAERHLVQNIGDGTFFHSGQLAVRAAVAAGVSITFKLLWNGTTAMTGGQEVVGGLASPLEVARMLLLEGVREVVVTTEDPRRYRRRRLPARVSVRPREEIVAVQERLATVPGVTVLIHDQPCATELRRARKRGLVPDPVAKVVINERVCEGCGDCQVKSNCLSLQTVDTPLGPKTRVDPDTCNVDRSCLQGDCPAFTLVEPARQAPGPAGASLPAPGEPPDGPEVTGPDRPVTVRIAGIGGTGVVTCAHLLGWAALIEGADVWGLDQTGLSQKAGPVISDLRIGPSAAERSNMLGDGQVDVLIAADLVAASVPEVLAGVDGGRARVVGSTSPSLSGPMVLGLERREVPVAELRRAVEEVAHGRATFVDAVEVAHSIGASETAANVVLLGVASQLGLLPVSAGAVAAAIERNGVSVAANLAAFDAGRRVVAGPAQPPPAPVAVPGRAPAPVPGDPDLPADVGGRLAWLADDLVAYQDERLARRFSDLVAEAWTATRRVAGDGRLVAAVGFGYHKLLAYKDEYEVARLLLEFPAAEGRTTWLLHPPALRARGLRHKLRLGPWARPALRVLRPARRLRGTALDPFGRTPLRRTERALPAEYAEAVRRVLAGLTPERVDDAVAIARLPDRVRGYEAVKERSVAAYRDELASRLAAWPAG